MYYVILRRSSTSDRVFSGVGVNVQNEKPTVNLNTVIADFNAANDTDVPGVSVEYMAARVCSEMELLVGECLFV